MQKSKICLSALVVLAMLLTCAAVTSDAADDETYAFGDAGVIVNNAGDFITAVESGESLILIDAAIWLNGNTVVTVPSWADVTIESTAPYQRAIVFDDSARFVVEGKLTVNGADFLQLATHQNKNGNDPAQYDNPWFLLAEGAELVLNSSAFLSYANYVGSMGLITAAGAANIEMNASVLISSKRGVFGQGSGLVCILNDTEVQVFESLYGGVFVLQGTTSIALPSPTAIIYNFTGLYIRAPTEPGTEVTFQKYGTNLGVYNDAFKIVYTVGEAFSLAAATEYTGPIELMQTTTFFVAVAYQHPSGTETYFSTPVEIECKYRPIGGWDSYSVTLVNGEGYWVVPGSGYAPIMEYDTTFTFFVDVANGYDRSVYTVLMNGVPIEPAEPGGYLFFVTVTGITAITVEGVEPNLYSVSLPTGTGYTIVPDSGYAAIMPFGSSFSFTVDIAYGYDGGNLKVYANGTEVIPVSGEYEVQVIDDTVITVDGVVALPMVNVTLTPGTGYTLTGASTAPQWSMYTFSLALDAAYSWSVPVVKVNGSVCAPSGPGYNYSVLASTNLVVTVEGVTINSYNITFVNQPAVLTFAGNATAVHGSTYTFTATVAGGYDITTLHVYVNGVEVFGTVNKQVATFNISNVSEDMTITGTVLHNGSNSTNSNPGNGTVTNPPGTNNGNGNNGNNGNNNGNNGNPTPGVPRK